MTSESGIILPPGLTLPKQVQPMDAPKDDETDEQKASVLPTPAGHKILCMVPDVSEKIEGSELYRPTEYMKQEEQATTILFVLKLGNAAYLDKERFPTGPWCKAGDFVLVRTYSGTRVKIFGKEFRVINDDQVDCVVDDPRGITRA